MNLKIQVSILFVVLTCVFSFHLTVNAHEVNGYVFDGLEYDIEDELVGKEDVPIIDKAENVERGRIPRIYVFTEEDNGNELNKEMGYIYAQVVVVAGEEETALDIGEADFDVDDSSAKIKVRGNSTAKGKKKPYNIKFSSKENVLGMGKAKKWCLLANCFDPTMLRNSVALGLAQTMGLAYTSEFQFVEVYMDGVYKGLFLLTEAVEAGATRVDIDIDNDDFLVELNAGRVEEGVTYIALERGGRYEVSEPEEPTQEQVANIKNVLQNIYDIVKSHDFEAIKSVIDVESFAKYYLLNELLKPVDFVSFSSNLYSKDGVLYAGPAWDFDISSGNVSAETYQQYADVCSWEDIYAASGFYGELMLYCPEFKDLVLQLYLTYQKDFLDIYKTGGIIDSLVSEYADEIHRNYSEAGWDVAYQYTYMSLKPYTTYAENVDYLKQWLKNRNNWLFGYWFGGVAEKLIGEVTIDQEELTLKVGDEAVLEVSYRPLNTTESTNAIWKSSDESVATVEEGQVVAIGPGTAIVSVKIGSLTAECMVYVSAVDATLDEIQLESESVFLQVGDSEMLSLTGAEEEYLAERGITYASSDEAVVTVENGRLEAIAVGKAIITVLVDSKLLKCEVLVSDTPFADVQLDNWYAKYVLQLNELGLIKGYAGTHLFGAKDTITRAQFVTILYRMAGNPEQEYLGVFSDVKDGLYYSTPVEWAAKIDVTSGYTGTPLFGPDDPIIREQLATMIYRYAQSVDGELLEDEEGIVIDTDKYVDANEISIYAKEAISWCVQKGILSGVNEGGVYHIYPDKAATRAECATMLCRYLQSKEE